MSLRNILVGFAVLAMLGMPVEGYGATLKHAYTNTFDSGNHILRIVQHNTGNKFKVSLDGTLDESTYYTALGQIKVNGGSLTISFNTPKTVLMCGQLLLNGGSVTLQLGDSNVGQTTLKRGAKNDGTFPTGNLIVVDNPTSTLTIQGYSPRRFIIHGNGNFNEPTGDWTTGFSDVTVTGIGGDGEVASSGALISLRSGTVDLKDVDLQYNYSNNGGALYVNVTTGNTGNLTMNNCTIYKCYAHNNGGAIYYTGEYTDANHESQIVLNNCTIANCFTYSDNGNVNSTAGGTIRTMGAGSVTINMNSCIIHSNRTNRCAGGFDFNAGRVSPARLVNCQIYGNQGGVGGVEIGSSAILQGCSIHDNYAKGDGGGLRFETYSSNTDIPNFAPYNSSIVLDANTNIYNNFALGQGGGVFFSIKPMQVNKDSAPRTIIYNNLGTPYETALSIEGAQIHDNTSYSFGGGFSFHKDPNTPTEYVTDLNVRYGSIYQNHANGGVGGAFYIAGAIPVNIGYASNILNIYGNDAATSGGGFYVDGGTVSVTNCNIGLAGNPNIAKSGNGGAVCVANGNLTVNGGIVQYNQAPGTGCFGGALYVSGGALTVNSGTIYGNYSQNGGGVSVANGLIVINGGSIYGNSAVNGGCVYTNGSGSLTVNGGEIFSNSSTAQGGAFYVSSSGLTTLSGGNVYSNTAGTDGGAFCIVNGNVILEKNGPSSVTVSGNTATAGMGGGLYATSGTSVTFNSANFIGNNAQNGGAVALIGGSNMTYKEGIVTGNKALSTTTFPTGYNVAATSLSGFGGGIFVADGNPGTNSSFEVVSDSKDKVGIYENEATNGGDDMFANAVNTSFKAPDPKGKVLANGFVSNGWFEDYVNGDSGYDYGTAVMGQGDPSHILRYRTSLEEDLMVYDASDILENAYSGYACIRTGYQSINITLTKTGLKKDESATFKMFDESGHRSYNIILTGTEQEKVSQVVSFLPISSKLTVSETEGGWSYTPGSAVITHNNIAEESQRLFEFSNTPKSSTPVHSEALKVNTINY